MKINWTHISFALLVGLLIGWFAGLRALHEEMHLWKDEKMVDRFSRELGLSADQKEKVSKILESKRQQVTVLRNEIKPRFEEIRATSKAEISKVLNADQQKRFNEIESKWEARRQKMRAQWTEK